MLPQLGALFTSKAHWAQRDGTRGAGGQVSFPEGGGKGKKETSRIDGNGNRDEKRNLAFQL